MKPGKILLIIATIFSFIQHFKFLMDCWFNMWLFRDNYPLFDKVITAYESFQITDLGMLLYFHLYSFALLVDYGDGPYFLWVHFSFALFCWIYYLILKKLLKFYRTKVSG